MTENEIDAAVKERAEYVEYDTRLLNGYKPEDDADAAYLARGARRVENALALIMAVKQLRAERDEARQILGDTNKDFDSCKIIEKAAMGTMSELADDYEALLKDRNSIAMKYNSLARKLAETRQKLREATCA